jgi:hypothetical protein
MSGYLHRDLLVALVRRTRLEVAVPQALDLVAHDPLIAVHSFRGDLLRGLMEVPDHFWSRHAALYEHYRDAVRAAALARLSLPPEERLGFWLPLEVDPPGDSAFSSLPEDTPIRMLAAYDHELNQNGGDGE